jgi:hypothetical protein
MGVLGRNPDFSRFYRRGGEIVMMSSVRRQRVLGMAMNIRENKGQRRSKMISWRHPELSRRSCHWEFAQFQPCLVGFLQLGSPGSRHWGEGVGCISSLTPARTRTPLLGDSELIGGRTVAHQPKSLMIFVSPRINW